MGKMLKVMAVFLAMWTVVLAMAVVYVMGVEQGVNSQQPEVAQLYRQLYPGLIERKAETKQIIDRKLNRLEIPPNSFRLADLGGLNFYPQPSPTSCTHAKALTDLCE